MGTGRLKGGVCGDEWDVERTGFRDWYQVKEKFAAGDDKDVSAAAAQENKMYDMTKKNRIGTVRQDRMTAAELLPGTDWNGTVNLNRILET